MAARQPQVGKGGRCSAQGTIKRSGRVRGNIPDAPAKQPPGRWSGPIVHRNLRLGGLDVMPLQSDIDQFDQYCPIERLAQKADRSGFQRARPDALFGEGRDENHRHGATLGNQKALQLYAGHAGHLNVRDHACRIIDVGRLQKPDGRRKGVSGVAERLHQPVGRSADERVIVDD